MADFSDRIKRAPAGLVRTLRSSQAKSAARTCAALRACLALALL
jgi:hypothetical protein